LPNFGNKKGVSERRAGCLKSRSMFRTPLSGVGRSAVGPTLYLVAAGAPPLDRRTALFI
jgi:hypothetical protein